jgi:hypothetical protein
LASLFAVVLQAVPLAGAQARPRFSAGIDAWWGRLQDSP